MTSKEIEITVNGIKEKIPECSTISSLISHFRENDFHLIVELNGRFIYPRLYSTTCVSEGDNLEFINPNIGG